MALFALDNHVLQVHDLVLYQGHLLSRLDLLLVQPREPRQQLVQLECHAEHESALCAFG